MPSVLSVSFTRSGGLVAAPGLTVRGRLELWDDGTGRVTGAGDYTREVPAAEGVFLAGVIRSVAAGRTGAGAPASAARDVHQLSLEITAAGVARTVAAGAAGHEKALALLRAWADREASAILAAHLNT